MSTPFTRVPDFWIPAAAFEILVGKHGLCRISDLSNEDANRIRPFLGDANQTVAVFSSGFLPTQTNASTLAGFDWIRHEQRPKLGEPDLNACHYSVGRQSESGATSGMYPVWRSKPSQRDTIIPHWPSEGLDSIVLAYTQPPDAQSTQT